MAKDKMKMAASGTIALETAAPQLGQDCVFHVTTSGLRGQQNPRVELRAYQGDVLVYAEARNLDAGGASCTFPPLGGGSSDWLNGTLPAVRSDPARCVALLYYWDNHPRQRQVVLADAIEFDAAGD